MAVVRYPRLPALGIIVAALAVTLCAALVSMNQAQAQLQTLEQEITDSDDPALWLRYADALFDAGRFQHAAQAYAFVRQQQPYHHHAQLQQALALAHAAQGDALYDYMQSLSFEHPLTATELFARPALQPFLTQTRFQELVHAARAQAVD